MANLEEQINKLLPFVSTHKQQVIEEVLAHRTRKLTVVLEDIYHPQNASAVMRTCECMGLQDVHVIEKANAFTISPRVVHGSSKWISLYRYSPEEKHSGTKACFRKLREKGYTILVTSLHENAVKISELEPQNKMALVFGNEISGVSTEAIDGADQLIKIPMYGFTESLNLSVSVAIALENIWSRYKKKYVSWGLDAREKMEIKLAWYANIVRRSDLILGSS